MMRIDKGERQTVMLYLLATTMLCQVMLFGFEMYRSEQKMIRYLQSMVGTAGEYQVTWGQELLNIIFETETSEEKLKAGEELLVDYGYTKEGMKIFVNAQRQGKDFLPLGIFVVFSILCLVLFVQRERWWKTRIAQMQEESERLKNQIKELQYVEVQNQRLQCFIENIAHQIKTPLSRVMMSLDLLFDSLAEIADGDRMEEKRGEAMGHIHGISQLITRLLHIGRLEAGAILFSKEKLIWKELLYDSYCEAVGETNGEFVSIAVTPKECDTVYYGDYEWLKEAFSNIFINCIQHDASGLPLEIDCKKMDGHYMIQIRDHGPGFDEEDMKHIFSRFYTPKNEKKGHVGIGLNLARLIIEGHSGIIHVENHENGGAVFKILCPVFSVKEKMK